MAADIGQTISLVGTYIPTNATKLLSPLDGTFLFNQLVIPDAPLVKYHYIMEGCYRDSAWPRALQSFSWPWLFVFAPLFVLCLATLNGQGWRDWRRLLVIVLFGCSSFVANKLFNMWIYDRGDVVSAIGATVVGILGTIYGHYSEGDALPSMIPGILVLLPVNFTLLAPVITLFVLMLYMQAGLSVVGGLSANFHDPASSVTSWLSSGLKMVQGRTQFPLLTTVPFTDFYRLSQPVTIGITVGLFASNLAIAIFISVAHKLKGTRSKKTHVGSAF